MFPVHRLTGSFVKGRYIGDNIRIVIDIMEKMNYQRKVVFFLLLLDFEKAFDSVEWKYMYKILEKFNFGPSFQNWLKCIILIFPA